MQCEYLNKAFEIDKKKARLLKSIELDTKIDYTETDTIGGLPQVEIKGFEPQSFSVDYTALTATGTNPLEEYNAWKKEIGKAGFFYLGDQQLGVDVFVLQSVALREGKINARGDFISGKIQLGLTQDIVAGG